MNKFRFGIPIVIGLSFTQPLCSGLLLFSAHSTLVADRHTLTFQVDFQRTATEQEVRDQLHAFTVRLVKAGNNSSRSPRWFVDVETRLSDSKVRSDLQHTPGVRSVRFVRYNFGRTS